MAGSIQRVCRKRRKSINMVSIERSTLKFLKTLRKNNNRDWVHANRGWYLESKQNFTEFTQALIGGINQFDKFGYIDAKDCLYRLHRDVRFSPDKTPYNYHFSAMMGKDGRKGNGASYYFRIKPGGLSVIAAGNPNMPDKSQMEKMRNAIDKKGNEFAKMINSKSFKNTFDELKGERYKRVPKPYSAEHPYADLLKMKYYWVDNFIKDKEVLEDGLYKMALAVYKKAHPMVRFINNHVKVKN
ncbi:MAG: DUF2461 domain-containing protein [Bacteroidia bacterium]|nr:DUF2461 domain-containing protein [Bacteroidia bacterium]